MDNLHHRLIFDQVKTQIKSSKIPSLVENAVMWGKYSFCKFSILLHVLRAEIVTTFGSEMVLFSTQATQNLRTSQGYILCILQHFETKFWNFTTFERFFLGISFFCLDLPRSRISL